VMKDIEKILAPFEFSFGKKQDLGTLLMHLKKNDVSTEEVVQHIEDLKKRAREDAKGRGMKACPDCGFPMRIMPVNDKPETQTGDPTDKSVWMCPKKNCMHTIYNKEKPQKVLRELIKKE